MKSAFVSWLSIVFTVSMATIGIGADCPCELRWIDSTQFLGGVECEHGPETNGEPCADGAWREPDTGCPCRECRDIVTLKPTGDSNCCENYAPGKICHHWGHDNNLDGKCQASEIVQTPVNSCDGTAVPNAPVCKCYECHPEEGCEVLFIEYKPWCGLVEDEKNTDKCKTKAAPPEAQKQIVEMRIPQKPIEDSTCDSNLKGIGTKFKCGGGKLFYALCVTDHCEEDTDEETTNIEGIPRSCDQ